MPDSDFINKVGSKAIFRKNKRRQMIKGHTKICRKNWETISGGYYCPVHDKFIDQEEDFVDDMKQIFKNEGLTCIYCKHLKDIYGSSCAAFPSGIPSPFLTGIERHTKPKYRQENSIVFSPKISKRPPKTKCPKCGSKKDVIPINYGLPMPELMKKAERGEIRLGGCVVSENDPQWYCKKCQKDIHEVLIAG